MNALATPQSNCAFRERNIVRLLRCARACKAEQSNQLRGFENRTKVLNRKPPCLLWNVLMTSDPCHWLVAFCLPIANERQQRYGRDLWKRTLLFCLLTATPASPSRN